jgi:ligand-binding sensor domain-containing protein
MLITRDEIIHNLEFIIHHSQLSWYCTCLSVILLLAMAVVFAGCGGLDRKPAIVWSTLVSPASQNLITLTVDARGVKWIGTDGDGALILSPDNQEWMPMSTVGSKEANTVVDIAVDRDNTVWVVTLVGVAVVEANGQTSTTYTTGRELPAFSLQDVAIDDFGNPWFATWGGGVSTLDRATDQWTHYTAANGLLDDHVAFIRVDAENNKWFGTALGVSLLTASGEWRGYGSAAGFGQAPVWAMVGDVDGSLWCATQGDGVIVINAEGQPVAQYTIENGLPDNTVNDILSDVNGNKWFATNNGLAVLAGDGSMTTFRVENGLGSNIVTELSLDPLGNIWAVTYGGGLSMYLPGDQ